MNLMELFVKIGADTSGLDHGIEEAENKSSGFASKIGEGLKTAAKVGAAAIGAASAAVGKLTTDAVKGYAEYEQLVGGVETLFGAGGKSLEEYAASISKTVNEAQDSYLKLMKSQNEVMKNADAAYKTAGLSANQYMETVTSFSASLLQSLNGDTTAAAKYSDMAIIDMADNANKMGTSMESIQTAYQGFAKQNYTMLDNLKLGYGGTKTEMARLIKDAEKLNKQFKAQRDESGNLVMSYSDVIDAIHIVQDNMGITGTTAKEASTTISGSLSSMKAAWSNLVTGLANNKADLDGLINNMVDSAETVFGNILPVAEKALSGIASLMERLAPIIVEKLPALIDQILPPVLSAATQLVNALVTALPNLLQIVIDQIPVIFEMIVPTFISLLPQIIDLGLQLILALADGLIEALPELIPAIVDVVLQIVDKLTDPDTLVQLIGAALQLILALADGIFKALPKLVEKAPEIVMNLVEGIIRAVPMIVLAVAELINTFREGFDAYYKKVIEVGSELVQKVKDGFWEKVEQAKQWGKDLIDNFINGIKEKWESLKQTVSSLAGIVKDFLGFSEPKLGPLSNFHTYAPDMMDLFAKGIKDNEHKVVDQIKKSFDFDGIIGNVEVKSNTSNGNSTGTVFNQTININREVATADEMAAAIELESRYGLMRGVALG